MLTQTSENVDVSTRPSDRRAVPRNLALAVIVPVFNECPNIGPMLEKLDVVLVGLDHGALAYLLRIDATTAVLVDRREKRIQRGTRIGSSH